MLKIYFKLKSLNTERKVNELIKNGVDVFDLERNDKEITFCVEKKNEEKVKEFFKNEECEVFSYGAGNILFFLKNRIGIVIGSVIFVILIALFSNLLMNIEVEGNNFVQTKQIIDILEQNGYNKLDFTSTIDVNDIENCLINSIPEISFASAMKRGNTLIIKVRENSQEQKENFSPLYAEFSGVISSIKIMNGTPLVSVGDVVKKGQVLVLPYEIISGNQVSVTPKAEIGAKVFIKGQVQYDISKKIIGRTGNFFEERNVDLLGMQILCSTSGDEQIKIDNYETEISEEYVNGIVPFKITKIRYFQLGEIGEPNFDRDKSMLEKESVYLAYEQISENFEIKNQSTQITKIENIYYITTYLEIEKNIAFQNN